MIKSKHVAIAVAACLIGICLLSGAVDKPKALVAVSIALPSRSGQNVDKAASRPIDISSDKSHLNVVISNVSDQPVRLWEEWNSWGYFNLSFDVANEKGRVLYRIEKKKNRTWTINFPSSFVLQPGEHQVIDVYFDEWWDLPFMKEQKHGSFPLRMRAVFEIKEDSQSKEHDVWTGRALSPYKNYLFKYWRGWKGVQSNIIKGQKDKKNKSDSVQQNTNGVPKTRGTQ